MPVNLHIGTWLAPIIIAASSLGIGTGVLTCIRYRTCSRFETLGVAFALGSGIIGWSTFWVGVAGYLTPVPLALLLLPGLVLLTRTLSVWRIGVEVPAGFQRLLVGLLLVSLGIDFLEALSPAADIDTTAYHFALPRRFLKAGAVEFVPVAVEGAVPLLTHMNYTLAFGLGGERGLQLWILITELVLIISFYAYARRFLSVSWALALSVVLLTTPAVIYGGGTGHVETRTALFMLVGAFAAADGNRVGNPGAAIVAGLAAGFFLGSKYYGLFGATALGLVLIQRHSIRPFILFCLTAAVAGGQWYAWNAAHTGDPLFPTLYRLLGTSSAWNGDVQAYFLRAYGQWMAVPSNLSWYFLYPLAATLWPLPAWEGGRTGLGPLLLLAMPWALGGLWALRRKPEGLILYRLAAVVLLFYSLWFFIPTNQLTRQLLPVFPIALLVFGAAATHWALETKTTRPWAAAVAFTVVLGLGIHALYGLNHLRYHVAGESRDEFMRRNVSYYDVVLWVNAHLPPLARVGNPVRDLNYLLDVPYVPLTPAYQAQVELHPKATDVRTFARQLAKLALTHLIVLPTLDTVPRPSFGISYLTERLVEAGCAEVLWRTPARNVSSRTMGLWESSSADVVVLRWRSPDCTLAGGGA